VKSLTEHLWFETPHRRDYLNITGTVEQLVHKSGVQEGLCLVNAMHITRLSELIKQNYGHNLFPLNCLQSFSERQRSFAAAEIPQS